VHHRVFVHSLIFVLSISHLQLSFILFFFLNNTPTTAIYTLSLHDALPISQRRSRLSHTSQCVRSRTPCASHAKALSLCPSAVCTSATAYAVTYCRRDWESMRASAAWASRRRPRTPYTYPSAATVGTQLRSGPVVAYCDSALSIWPLAW